MSPRAMSSTLTPLFLLLQVLRYTKGQQYGGA
jgi:hypothetical protein